MKIYSTLINHYLVLLAFGNAAIAGPGLIQIPHYPADYKEYYSLETTSAVSESGRRISLPICRMKELPPGFSFSGNPVPLVGQYDSLLHKGISREEFPQIVSLIDSVGNRNLLNPPDSLKWLAQDPSSPYVTNRALLYPAFNAADWENISLTSSTGQSTLITKELYEKVRKLAFLGMQTRVSGPLRGEINFGAGVKAYSLSQFVQICGPIGAAFGPNGVTGAGARHESMIFYEDFTERKVLFEIPGLLQNTQRAKVEARTVLQLFWGETGTTRSEGSNRWIPGAALPATLPGGNIALRLEYKHPNGQWITMKSASPKQWFPGAEVVLKAEAMVNPGRPVRAILDTKYLTLKPYHPLKDEQGNFVKDDSGHTVSVSDWPAGHFALQVEVKEATLFGAECQPDLANPGECYQD